MQERWNYPILDAHGCFLLDNCLDTALVDGVHQALISLFSLSSDKKRQFLADKMSDPLAHGFSPFGVSKALDTGIPNLLETWDISPEKHNWPEALDHEWYLLREYQRALARTAIAGLELFTVALGVPHTDLTGLIDKHSIEGIHLIHYFPVPPSPVPGACRHSKHCDNTLITLIPSPFPVETGVEIFNRQTQIWEHFVIAKRSYLVQAGLLLEYITCGAVKASLHTISTPRFGSARNVPRYSSPFFCSPPRDSTIRVLNRYRTDSAGGDVPLHELQTAYFKKIF